MKDSITTRGRVLRQMIGVKDKLLGKVREPLTAEEVALILTFMATAYGAVETASMSRAGEALTDATLEQWMAEARGEATS